MTPPPFDVSLGTPVALGSHQSPILQPSILVSHVSLRQRFAEIVVDDVPAEPKEYSDQVEECASLGVIRDVNMPMLVQLSRLLQAVSFERGTNWSTI